MSPYSPTAHSFEHIAGDPVLDLVNTLDWRFRPSGPEELLTSYTDLVHFTAESRLLSTADASHLLRSTAPRAAGAVLRRTIDLREAASAVLYNLLAATEPPPAALASLQTAFHAVRSAEHLAPTPTHLEWRWSTDTPGPDLPFLLLARAAASLLTSPGSLGLLRDCGDPSCRWLFLDTSKNHTRRWCDMKVCGNRMKARRFKAQHKP